MMDNVHDLDIVYPDVPSPPQPTPEQLARAAALRGFERRYLYLPLATVSILWLLTVLVMLWLAVVSVLFPVDIDQAAVRALFSGIADIVLIVVFSFWLLIGMIPIGLAGFIWWKRREMLGNRPSGPDPLPIMWRIENIVVMISERVTDFLPLLARPVILAYAIAGYIRGLLIEIKKIVTRS